MAMSLSIELIVNDVLCVASAITALGIALFAYINGPRKTANITWALTMLSVAVFFTSHAIGVSIADPVLSRDILMFNLVMYFIGVFSLHSVLSLLGIQRQHRTMLIFLYVSSFLMIVLFLIFPNSFLLPSVPKMYFPEYYNPGMLNWIRVVFLYGVIVPLDSYYLIMAYLRAASPIERSQYKYMILTVILGYGIAFIPNLLVYNIPVDPLWGGGAVIVFAVPFIYGAVRYRLYDVRVIAQQAFYYTLAVAGIGSIITLFNYSNVWILQDYPAFPLWITALISAVLVVTLSVIIWSKLRQSDILKYEFITTVTHKFRTPLTHIKWAAENLSKMRLPEEGREQVKYIGDSNAKLVEMTNLLVGISETETDAYEYRLERADLAAIAAEAVAGAQQQIRARRLDVRSDLGRRADVLCDIARIRFVMQTLIENAVNYSPEGGKISVVVRRDGRQAEFKVNDSGIGIAPEELPLLFVKFYRSKSAQLADTEGMGIGLYVSKEIIERHRGRIWAESAGLGKGASMAFSLPVA